MNINIRRLKIFGETTTTPIGLPLALFPKDFQPSIDIHKAIMIGMGNIWNEVEIEVYTYTIREFVKKSKRLEDSMKEFHLTYDETSAIAYYTSDASKVLGVENHSHKSPYGTINQLLAERSMIALENWKPFIFFLINGLNKLPDVKTKVSAWDS